MKKIISSVIAAAAVLGICYWILLMPSKKEMYTVVDESLIACFPDSIKDKKKEPVFCEASAVAFDGHRIIIASDKPVPVAGYSPVFEIEYKNLTDVKQQKKHYYTQKQFINTMKFEDCTVTPDGAYTIAITGFDRVKDQSHEFDAYNTMLIWPSGEPDRASVIAASTVDGIESSVTLRSKIAHVLTAAGNEASYFKIEGLSAIPGNRLLMGVREIGKKFNDFTYCAIIIDVSYSIVNGKLTLGEDWKLAYRFEPSAFRELKGNIAALSGLEYDRFNNCLWIITSCESEEKKIKKFSGYCWSLTMNDYLTERKPTLVTDTHGTALSFAHKPEGIAPLDKNHLLIMFDDDRMIGTEEEVKAGKAPFVRKPNEAAFCILRKYKQK